MISDKQEGAVGASLIKILRTGGLYWKRDRHDSPGHSFAIPNATPFKIAVDGPSSNQFVAGVCSGGHFVISDGALGGQAFPSASAAVNAVRDPQSNAFLYVHFRLNGMWILADTLRRSDESRLDPVEEAALENALRILEHHPKGKSLKGVAAIKKAAELVNENPVMIERARRQVATLAEFEISN